MTVFFHHVGDGNARRDFPRTIGEGSVKRLSRYSLGEVEKYLPKDLDRFQVWGIPSAASQVHKVLREGDWFILVGTTSPGGGVEYIGKVDFVLEGEQRELSRALWTEDRFPWVFILNGEMCHLPWPDFLKKIGYAQNFQPRGRIYGVSSQKMRDAGYDSDFDLIRALKGEVAS